MNNDGGGWFAFMLLVWFFTVVSVEPAIYPESIAYAEKVCENNGGWKKINEGYSPYSSVECNNGAEFEYEWKTDWVK